MNDSKKQIRSTQAAFDHACIVLGSVEHGWGENEVTRRLNRDFKLRDAVVGAFYDMGQTRLINLTHSYDEARISLAFHAGNGKVIKVIPQDFFDDSNPVHSLPPISCQKIDSGWSMNNGVLVASFPYKPDSYLSQQEIEGHEIYMNEGGLTTPKDDRDARNFREMGDKLRTKITIDSHIYQSAHNGKNLPQKYRDAWREYLAAFHPEYKDGAIKSQTEQTDFSFRSYHDRNTSIAGFDFRRTDPIILDTPKPKPKKNFFSFLFPSDDDPAPSY